MVTELEQLTGCETRRIHIDKSYRGHHHAENLQVSVTGHARRVTAPNRREMKRRAAVEPVIGHVKVEHHNSPLLTNIALNVMARSHQCHAIGAILTGPQGAEITCSHYLITSFFPDD